MFSFWSGGSNDQNKAPQEFDVDKVDVDWPEEDDQVEEKEIAASDSAIKPAVPAINPVFFNALQQKDASIYTQEQYADQYQHITHEMLFSLIELKANQAFCWLLKQRTFDLNVEVVPSSSSKPVRLLDKAILDNNIRCAGGLLEQDVRAAIWVPVSILTDVDHEVWGAFYKKVTRSSHEGVKLAMDYLEDKRGIHFAAIITGWDEKRLKEKEDALEAFAADSLMKNAQLKSTAEEHEGAAALGF